MNRRELLETALSEPKGHTMSGWTVDEEQLCDGQYRIVDRDGRLVATCCLKDARRVVACTNACVNVTTEWLEQHRKTAHF